jgi:Fic family protein
MALIEDFRGGRFARTLGYAYFLPESINREWSWRDPRLNILLEKASAQLGQLNSFAQLVPNIDLFIHIHVTKEAFISSRIEGTQTTLDEALLSEEDIVPERRDDWLEVQNYTQAMNRAVAALTSLPVSSRLIRQTHEQLMDGARGKEKLPGEFRRSQNWIGGTSIANAVFIPPAADHVNELMGDLELFLNNKDNVPDLIRIGMAHYQFETIHPFLDGNGRIGRLLITLYLVSRGMLSKPLLYLSTFFDTNRSLYFDNLMRVREKSDMLHWLRFFLEGVESTARQACETLSQVLALKTFLEELIRETLGKRTDNALTLLNKLFETPVIRVSDVMKVCKISPATAGQLVAHFVAAPIAALKEITGQTRNRVFVFEPYLQLFR